MTTLDLEPIKERLAEATPGPWDFHVLPQSVGITVATIHSEHGPRETCWTVDFPPEIGGMGTEKDAEFIANAPEDIAALVAEVERLRGQVDAVKALHRKFPIYDTLSEDCTEHDQDAFGMEVDDGDWYCTKHIAYCACEICFTDYGERIEYPCPTIRALEVGE